MEYRYKRYWNVHNNNNNLKKNCKLYCRQKRVQSIRLLFELSNYADIDIPLAFQVLPMYRPLWRVYVSIFLIPLKNCIDRLCNLRRNY